MATRKKLSPMTKRYMSAQKSFAKFNRSVSRDLKKASRYAKKNFSVKAVLKKKKDVEKKILKAAWETSGAGMHQATLAGAEVVLVHARANAPFDSGNLMASLEIKGSPLPKRAGSSLSKLAKGTYKIWHKVVTGTRQALGIKSSAKGYYPASMEFGWERGGKKHPGKPYLRPAIYDNKVAIRAAAARAIRAAVERGAR